MRPIPPTAIPKLQELLTLIQSQPQRQGLRSFNGKRPPNIIRGLSASTTVEHLVYFATYTRNDGFLSLKTLKAKCNIKDVIRAEMIGIIERKLPESGKAMFRLNRTTAQVVRNILAEHAA